MERQLKIASPCSANWDQMVGDDRVRHCSECNLNVYNFSAVTAAEVERIVTTHEGRLCARMYRRADGTLITQDCPVGLRAVLRRETKRVARIVGAALSAAMTVAFAAAQAPTRSQPTTGRSSPLAQIKTPTAAIDLFVEDLTGTAVPSASVTLTNQDSLQTHSGITDAEGRLVFSRLADGRYEVKAEHDQRTSLRTVTVRAGWTVEEKLILDLEIVVDQGWVTSEPKIRSVGSPRSSMRFTPPLSLLTLDDKSVQDKLESARTWPAVPRERK